MRIRIAILFFAFCLSAVSAQVADAADTAVATASELFALDVDAIKEKYGDEMITVRGVAVNVGPDTYGLPSVTLSDTLGGKYYVLCVLPYGDYMKLGDIAEGEEVTMSGSPRGKTSEGILVMKQSVLVAK